MNSSLAEKRILPFGDAVLRVKCRPVSPSDPDLSRLLTDLADTLYAAEGRAGLAAPQIGIPARVVVLDCGSGLVELINPEIIDRRGEEIGPEACLSLPGYTGIVNRAGYVKVKTLNRKGETCFVEGEGFLARCLQHEIDHLDGVLYIDRVEPDALFKDATHEVVDPKAIPS